MRTRTWADAKCQIAQQNEGGASAVPTDREALSLSLSAVLLCQRCRPPSLLPSFPSGWRSRLGFVRPTLHARALPLRSEAASSLIFVFFTQKSKVGQILALPRAPCSNQPSARAAVLWVCLSTAFCRARSAPFLASPPSSPSHSLWSLFGQSICLSLWSADRTDMHAFILYPSIEDELSRRLGGGVMPNFAVKEKTEEGAGDWRMPLALFIP